jgi:hypothetical protein
MQNWQLELPEAQGSVVHTTERTVELFRSVPFRAGKTGGPYQILAIASWDDRCRNGSNSFRYSESVVLSGGTNESEYVSLNDVSSSVLETIPASCRALDKWNGCYPFGPWYYLENGLFQAGDRDHWGLRAGESRQMKTNRGELMWELKAADGLGRLLPLYALPTLMTGDKPTDTYKLEWHPCLRVGEGKPRDLQAFRRTVIWPEATMADIEREDLPEVLKARLPGLLREFRTVIEGLGFPW